MLIQHWQAKYHQYHCSCAFLLHLKSITVFIVMLDKYNENLVVYRIYNTKLIDRFKQVIKASKRQITISFVPIVNNFVCMQYLWIDR